MIGAAASRGRWLSGAAGPRSWRQMGCRATSPRAAASSEAPRRSAAASPTAAVALAGPAIPLVVPQSAHDAITRPGLRATARGSRAAAGRCTPRLPRRALRPRQARPRWRPAVEELDTGWDLGDEDPDRRQRQARQRPRSRPRRPARWPATARSKAMASTPAGTERPSASAAAIRRAPCDSRRSPTLP